MTRPMKYSGIDWLGDIPADWDCCKLKYLISSLNSGTSITATDLTEDGYPVYGGGQQIGFFSQFNIEDTLIIGRVGSCGHVTKILGKAWATDNALIVTTDFPINYLYYILVAAELNELSTSNAQPLITSRKVLNHKVAVCWDKDEQERIAAYLDDKCGRIDSVIAKTVAAVAEYKKLKQAIITRAVTRGIRPNRTLKHSGIDWLGDIPDDWELVRFRYVLHERNEKNFPVKSMERLSLSIDLGVTLYAEKITNLDRFKDDFEQYKIAYVGDLVMNSMNMIVGATGVSNYYGCVSPAYYTFYDDTDDHVTAKFCEYIFRSKTMLRVLYSLGKGIYAIVRGDDRVNTCRLKISREDLRNIKIPVPPIDEQREIAAYLDEKTSAIDSLVAKKNQLVMELERLKKSLIFEYVTGKKEVAQ